MKFLVLPLLLALLFLTGCNETKLPPGYPRMVSEAPIGGPQGALDTIYVGDKLEVYVIEDEGFNGVYTVRDGGNIIFPKVGRVQVAGRSLSEAEAIIKGTFEKNILKVATVILERHGAKKEGPAGPDSVTIYLSGSVNRPGGVQVPYIGGQRPSAYQALVHGGGMSDFARPSKAYLIRNNGGAQERIDLDLDDIGEGRAQDVLIQNGDIIVVPQRGIFF